MFGRWLWNWVDRLLPGLILPPVADDPSRPLKKLDIRSAASDGADSPAPVALVCPLGIPGGDGRPFYGHWRQFVGRLATGRLPTGTCVEGSLSLARLRIRSLPAGLTVRGDLDLRQCQRLRTIGDGLIVLGDLKIGGKVGAAPWWQIHLEREVRHGNKAGQPLEPITVLSKDPHCPLERLPESLLVLGKLILSRCVALTALPDSENFHLAGGLAIHSCPQLLELPDPLIVGGDLTLSACPRLKLPETLEVKGSLRLTGLKIQRLPQRLKVGGSLILDNCGKLQELPPGLTVRDDLIIRGSPIRELPRDLHAGRLVLDRCEQLIELPATLSVGGDIQIHRCSRLQAFPKGIIVRSNLSLTEMTALTSLPKGLHIPGKLNLAGATALTALPEGLRIQTRKGLERNRPALNLAGCSSLLKLPSDLRVDGPLEVTGSGLTELPHTLRNTRILWRGLAVQQEVVFAPESLSPQQILGERNAELRRLTLERLGVDRVLDRAKALILDEDTDAGGRRRLVEVQIDRQGWRYLHVRCPSTSREYLLRVAPTLNTCAAAAAWLAGFNRPDDYRPVLET